MVVDVVDDQHPSLGQVRPDREFVVQSAPLVLGPVLRREAEVGRPLAAHDRPRQVGADSYAQPLGRGTKRLLGQPAIGICGSRHATDEGLRAAQACAEDAAKAGFVVVSGYARGVDTRAHLASLRSAGNTVMVLAEGIERFRWRREYADTGCLDGRRVTVLSQVSPRQTWTVGAAMARNATIMGLSRALVVVEAGETGGTLAAGREGLAAGRPVVVLDLAGTESPGNRILAAEGARRVGSRGDFQKTLASIGTAEATQGTLWSGDEGGRGGS